MEKVSKIASRKEAENRHGPNMASKSEIVHGLVVPFGTSGMVQVDRPLVLVPLVPRRSEDPLLLVPLVPLRSEDPLLLVPLVPRTPTCPNLYHLVVPLVLSQLSFLRFFFEVLIVIPFFEKHF